eukprot:14446098-Heterocapsa_arctica.AAC.1
MECASANLAQTTLEPAQTTLALEQMRFINDAKPVPAIIGDETEPVDRDLFNTFILRCREVNDKIHVLRNVKDGILVLRNQLSESEGFQF